jgi:hypothetical protein
LNFHKNLKAALAADRFEWRKHALQRLAERGIAQAAVLEVLSSGERIEDYPDDAPYPSALFLGWIEGKPLHSVAALDTDNNWAYIITAYEPDLDHFESDYKTRREGR